MTATACVIDLWDECPVHHVTHHDHPSLLTDLVVWF